MPQVPGLQMEKLIREMSDETEYVPDELHKYSCELWMSLREYEESIRKQELGLQLELKRQAK